MAHGDDLVKFITQQVVTYIETPKEVRQQAKVSSKEQRESWTVRWFGMIPMSIRMGVQQMRSDYREKDTARELGKDLESAASTKQTKRFEQGNAKEQ
ncbi:hypothetical protein D3C73_1244930 [compost metagenome]